MRSRLSEPVALLFLLSALFLFTAPALAEDTLEDEYEERARVLRVSLLKGEVSVKRVGEDEWEQARLNAPLVEGDLLATGRDSRLEVQLDARNFIRLGPDSLLKVITLRDEGIALSLYEGTATVRLARFDKDKEYFELDAPGTTVAAEKTGLYRVDVEREGAVRVTVRDDGRARLYSQDSGFVLRNNRTARLARTGGGEGDWEFSAALGLDEWDGWNDERERYLASRLRHEGRERYYDPEVYGAEELDAYGDWVYHNEYGYVWRPHTTVINNYYDWAPYRYGRWVWCPPYGWTWVADEPWGWAPYHYGRWVHVGGRWCWAPRGYGYRYGRAWWRPALVVFVNVNHGRDRYVCWYPLTYGQRDPRGRHWDRRYERLTPLGRRDLDHIRRSNPALLRAVSTASARDFGVASMRARPAAGDLAQRALTGEPVRGQPPVPRAVSSRGGTRAGGAADVTRPTGANGREVLTINRPDSTAPGRAIFTRPTGAAARTPGVPLDGELRRTRVFNNREPRAPRASAPPDGSEGSGSVGRGAGAGTGAVERPRSTGSSPTNTGGPGEDMGAPARVRPRRPDPPAESAPGNPSEESAPTRRRDGADGGAETRRARPERPRGDDGSNTQSIPRFEPRIRPRDEERPAPPTRREEPREAPAPRNDPPPRQEPPRQAAPRSEPRREQPRNDPPPRQEAPRNDPPPRQESPRQEAPRQAPPRPDTPRRERP